MEYVMYKKVITLISLSLVLIGCQNTLISTPPPAVSVDFELPADSKLPPKVADGSKSNAKIKEGEYITFNFPKGTGSVLLIVQGKESINSNGETIYLPETPFKDGVFTIRLSNGNNKSNTQLIGDGTVGNYKYTIVDVSGNPRLSKRPPLDPYIQVGPRVNF